MNGRSPHKWFMPEYFKVADILILLLRKLQTRQVLHGLILNAWPWGTFQLSL